VRLILEHAYLRSSVKTLHGELRLKNEQYLEDLKTIESLRRRVQALQSQLDTAQANVSLLQRQLDKKARTHARANPLAI